MKTKTASVRLPKEMFAEIDSICDGVGCSRNDWIKDTLNDKLREENSQELGTKDIELEDEPSQESRIRVFDCKSGTLYENGITIGDCADYKMDDGKVYDKNDNFLGVTRGFYQK